MLNLAKKKQKKKQSGKACDKHTSIKQPKLLNRPMTHKNRCSYSTVISFTPFL